MVNHSGGSVMLWECSSASGPARLAVSGGNVNSALSKQLWESVSGQQSYLKLEHNWLKLNLDQRSGTIVYDISTEIKAGKYFLTQP